MVLSKTRSTYYPQDTSSFIHIFIIHVIIYQDRQANRDEGHTCTHTHAHTQSHNQSIAHCHLLKTNHNDGGNKASAPACMGVLTAKKKKKEKKKSH